MNYGTGLPMMNSLKIEQAPAFITILTALAVGLSAVFLMGYTTPVGMALIGFASYRDLLGIVAQALVGSFFLSIVISVLMNLAYGLNENVLDPEFPFVAGQQSLKSASARALFAIIDRAWNAKRVKSIHLAVFLFSSLGVACIVCPKDILGIVDYCFFVAMFLLVMWRITISRLSGKGALHGMFLGCIALLSVVFVYGNYSLYRDAFYMPVYIEFFNDVEPHQQYVLLRRFGEMILVLDPRTSRQILVSDRGAPLLQFQEPLCNVSEVIGSFVRFLNKHRVPSCEFDWARVNWKSFSYRMS